MVIGSCQFQNRVMCSSIVVLHAVIEPLAQVSVGMITVWM